MNETIADLIKFLQVIIILGASIRIIYCLILIPIQEEDSQSLKVRIKTTLGFAVVSQMILFFVSFIQGYFR